MVSLLEFKQALGDYANELTEPEIERLKEIEEQLADILIEHVLHENSSSTIVSSPVILSTDLPVFTNS